MFFSYPTKKDVVVLSNLNLKINSGDVIGFVGARLVFNFKVKRRGKILDCEFAGEILRPY